MTSHGSLEEQLISRELHVKLPPSPPSITPPTIVHKQNNIFLIRQSYHNILTYIYVYIILS